MIQNVILVLAIVDDLNYLAVSPKKHSKLS
jgi:hypothetical protein